jgi:hypothetical protein
MPIHATPIDFTVKATGVDTFLIRPERRLQDYEVRIIALETKIPQENITSGIVSRTQLLKLVDVLTRPRPKPNPRGE